MSASYGSGLWSKMKARIAHLLQSHGISAEVADVRKDLIASLTPLVAVTCEEYTNPPAAVAAAIKASTATKTSAVVYQYAQLDGTVGQGVISPPRNITVTTGGGTATHAPASFTITGFDVQGNPLTENITGTNGGAATYAGVKCFAQVTSVSAPAGGGTDATFTVDTGIVIGLANTPKLRTGQALPLIRRELFDAAVVTNGALTLPATNPPFGAYTPNSAPTTLAPAVVTGTADITAGALYGVGATLDGLVLDLTINGVHHSLTLNGTTNSATEVAFLAALNALWTNATFTQGGSGGNKLVITDKLSGFTNTIVTASTGVSTSNTALGLTASHTTNGGGHQYAIDYEFDATTIADA
jgi:hypothetical protein